MSTLGALSHTHTLPVGGSRPLQVRTLLQPPLLPTPGLSTPVPVPQAALFPASNRTGEAQTPILSRPLGQVPGPLLRLPAPRHSYFQALVSPSIPRPVIFSKPAPTRTPTANFVVLPTSRKRNLEDYLKSCTFPSQISGTISTKYQNVQKALSGKNKGNYMKRK